MESLMETTETITSVTSADELSSPALAAPTHEPSTYLPQLSRFLAAAGSYFSVPQLRGNSSVPCTIPERVNEQPNSIQEEIPSQERESETEPLVVHTTRLTPGVELASSTISPGIERVNTYHLNTKAERGGWIWSWSWRLFSKPSFVLSVPFESPYATTKSFYEAPVGHVDSATTAPNTNIRQTIDTSSTLNPSSVFPSESNSIAPTNTGSYCISVSVDSPSIYRWSAGSNLFIGKLNNVPAPLQLETQWIKIVRPQLLRDLRMVIQSLPRSLSKEKTFVEPELCMVGELDSQSDTIDLKPIVWIRCGSKRCKRAVQQAVEDLAYLHVFSGGRVQVHQRAPRLAAIEIASDGGSTDSDSEPSNAIMSAEQTPTVAVSEEEMSECGMLRVFVSNSSSYSAIGSKVTFVYERDGFVQQRDSTLGGLISVEGKIYGLTTAHGVAEMLDDYPVNDLSSDTASDDGCESDMGDEIARLNIESSVASPPQTSQSVEKHLDNGWSEATLKAFSASEGKDFALIGLSTDYLAHPNIYQQRTNNSSITYGVDEITLNLGAGPVWILCSPTDVRRGYLLDGDSKFLDRDTVISTKKIQTETPLGLGLSGTWVSRGSYLIGMLIAVYDDEPYVHMLPIEQVFSDIQKVLYGKGFTMGFCDVGLPHIATLPLLRQDGFVGAMLYLAIFILWRQKPTSMALKAKGDTKFPTEFSMAISSPDGASVQEIMELQRRFENFTQRLGSVILKLQVRRMGATVALVGIICIVLLFAAD